VINWYSPLKKVVDNVQIAQSGVIEITNGFKRFHISSEELDTGECEVGILIPRNSIDNSLVNLKKELDSLDFILKHFAEAVSSEQPKLEIRTISSSDLSFFLDYAPPAAAFLAVAVERIIAFYKRVLEIKKLRLEIKALEVPEDKLEPLDSHVNSIMDTGITEFLDEEFDNHCKIKDAGRKNELRNGIQISLNRIANRIDRGFNFEINVGYTPPEEGDEESSENESKIDVYTQTILDAQKNMEYMKTEGEQILSLSENDKSTKKTKS